MREPDRLSVGTSRGRTAQARGRAEPDSEGLAPTILPLVFDEVSFEAGGRRLLDRMDFRLEAGPVSVILGANGAGKSLTLRLCHGLLRPTSGRVCWGRGGDSPTPRQRALVLQRPVLLRRSVAANVDFALRVQGWERARRRARVARVLEETGLADFAGRPARRLSVGEQQRVALARAWALDPEVVFLDEPAAALDPSAGRALETVIRRLRDQGTKIVMTTHDLLQARRMADEILLLHRGRLLEQTAAAEFFEDPRTPEAKAFLRGELLG